MPRALHSRGHRTGLDRAVAKRKEIPASAGNGTPVFQPVA